VVFSVRPGRKTGARAGASKESVVIARVRRASRAGRAGKASGGGGNSGNSKGKRRHFTNYKYCYKLRVSL
jgi:hypothetical protein